MSKNKNLFSIGEIAKSINITRKIILNYEAKGLIKPDVKEGHTGNRYYSIDTFTQIRSIRVFQSLGLSLDEIREYFSDKTDLTPLIKRLEALRDEIELNIARLYERTNKSDGVIIKVRLSAQSVYAAAYKTSSVAEKSAFLRQTALIAMRSYGTDTTKRMYFTEFPLDEPDNITFAVAVPPESEGENILKTKESDALSIIHHGAYESLPAVREKLLSFARENGLKPTGTCRHVYIEGPPQHKDKSKFITQVLLPIEKD